MRSIGRTNTYLKRVRRSVIGSIGLCRNNTPIVPSCKCLHLHSRSLSTTPKNSSQSNCHARLLLSGPNASGIVASFSQLLYNHSCDIVDCASESSSVDDFENEQDHKLFFQRILFDYGHLNKEKEEVEREILGVCRQFGMKHRLVSVYCLLGHFFGTCNR